MKIAIFTDSFRDDLGGGSKVAIDLASGLMEKGHDILIVTGKHVGDLSKRFNIFNLPSIKYPLYNNAEMILPSLSLIETLKNFQPDIIHYHDPFLASIMALMVSKYFKKKVVGTIHVDPKHVSEYSVKIDNGVLAKALVGFVSRFSDALIFVSRYQRKVYASYLKRKGFYRVIYPGIPDYFFLNDTPVFGKRIITVSRLAPEKNLKFAFKVMSLVQKEIKVEYIVVGDGPERENLKNYAKKVGLDVKFLGNIKREKLPELYKSSSLFFLPSKTETFGLVFAEAMACGLPIVALNAGAAPEVVKDAGFICKENEIEVKNAIIKLLNNKSLWENKVSKAKLRSRKFKMDVFIENHIKLYKLLAYN